MKNKKIPMRKCVGCMESKPKNELIRIAGCEGNIIIDINGRAKGRGIYLCPKESCFELAQKKRAIGRGLAMEIDKEQLDRLFEDLKEHEK